MIRFQPICGISRLRRLRSDSLTVFFNYAKLSWSASRQGGLVQETAVISLGLLVQQAAAFLSGIAVARALGVTPFGEFGILKTMFTLLLIVTPLGLDLALLKHIPLLKARPDELQRLTNALRALVLVFNLAILLGTIAFGGAWLQRLYPNAPHLEELVIITAAGLAFASDMQLLGAQCRASDRVVTFAVVNTIILPVLRAVLIGGVLLIGLQLRAVVWTTTVSLAISSLILMVASGTRITRPSFCMNIKSMVLILRESLWMAGCLVAYQAIRLLDVIILGSLTTLKATGSYVAVSTIAQLISILPQALSQRLGPDIAFHYGRDDRASMVDVLRSYFTRACLLSGFLYGGIAAFGSSLDTVFGEGFRTSWSLPLLLATGWFISAVLSPFGYVLSMTGRHRQELIILLLGVVVLVFGLFVATPALGAEGAALAVLATFIFVNVLRFWLVQKTLRLSVIPLRPMLFPLGFLACAFCVKAMCMSLGHSFLTLLIESLVYTAISLIIGALAAKSLV